MSNGNQQACCVLRLCCPDGQAKRALAGAIEGAVGGSSDESYQAIASWLLDHFDLVPKGVGEVIAKLYREPFGEAFKKEAAEA